MTITEVNHPIFRIVSTLAVCCGLLLLLAVPTRAEPPRVLSFAVMLSTFDNGRLTQVQAGELVVSVNGTIWNSYLVGPGGLLNFTAPTDSVANWTLSQPGLTERRFRSEVVDGLLRISNLDRESRSVSYYETDSGAYALEYYQDRLYICNQGSPNGPILGKLKRGDRIPDPTAFSSKRRSFLKSSPAYHTIPTADIIIGGDISDWAGVDPIYTDGQGDLEWDKYSGVDIKQLYLAKDSGFLYMMLTLHDGPPRSDPFTQYAFEAGRSWDMGDTDGNIVVGTGFMDGSWQVTASQRTVNDVGPIADHPAGYSAAGPDFVEWKIGLGVMGDLDGKYAFGYTHVFDFGDQHPQNPLSDKTDSNIRLGTGAGAPAPPGGPEDDFGGIPDPATVVAGVVDNVQDLPAGDVISEEFNSARTSGQTYADNRVVPLSEGSDPASAATRPGGIRAGGIPGVVFQWIYAGDRAPDELFLPLGESGILADGVTVQALFDANNDVPLMVLLRAFPPEFLISLSPGVHRLKYWLQDSEGTKSNERWEDINIG